MLGYFLFGPNSLMGRPLHFRFFSHKNQQQEKKKQNVCHRPNVYCITIHAAIGNGPEMEQKSNLLEYERK